MFTRQEVVLCAFNAILAILSIMYVVRSCSSGKRSTQKPDNGWDEYILVSFVFTGVATITLIAASFVATIRLTTPLIWRATSTSAVVYLISYLLSRKHPNSIPCQILTILAMLVCLNGFALLMLAPHP